ncbi:hypothetical protein A4A49_12489 [Nicotiana attenuata]|uniref:Uncharacterized protein n=1 Tax=Nicotiana attenuata TaxID=49451 RepID=A0A1J6HVD0_NICAT|nr:hypothetical protein A4A49_12489 [Nicotiana attenuata]
MKLRQQEMEQKKGNKEDGVLVHSQVRKIKQETEKINDHPSLQQQQQQAEKKTALGEITGKQQQHRSPLGLALRN